MDPIIVETVQSYTKLVNFLLGGDIDNLNEGSCLLLASLVNNERLIKESGG